VGASQLPDQFRTSENTIDNNEKVTRIETTMSYLQPDSRMTLREGLAEYFRQNSELMGQGDLPRDLGVGLQSHDVAHVVFGCDTSVVGEVVLSRWSFFGITGSIRPYLIGYRRSETRVLFKDAMKRFRLSMLWPMVKFASLAFVRSLRMRERWPYQHYSQYLDLPLYEIREHFGIRVLGPL
jgi:hypothetical protein